MIKPVSILDIYNVPAVLDPEADIPDLFEEFIKQAWFLHPFNPPNVTVITESRTFEYTQLGWLFATIGNDNTLRKVSSSEGDETFSVTAGNEPDPNTFGVPDDPTLYRTETTTTVGINSDRVIVRRIKDDGDIEVVSDNITSKTPPDQEGDITNVTTTVTFSRTSYFSSTTTTFSESGPVTTTLEIILSEPDTEADAFDRFENTSDCPEGVIGTNPDSTFARTGSARHQITKVKVKYGFKLTNLILKQKYTLKYSVAELIELPSGIEVNIVEDEEETITAPSSRTADEEGDFSYLVEKLYEITPENEEENGENCGQGPQDGIPELELPNELSKVYFVTNFVIYPDWARIIDVPQS